MVERITEAMVAAAKELVDSVSFDENGALIGGKWMGGHGGLLSRETHQKADKLRRAIAAYERAAPTSEGSHHG